MKEHLDDLTIAEFVTLISGDTSVLVAKGEKVSFARIAKVTRDIVFEYREITDSKGLKTYISDLTDMTQARFEEIVFASCVMLIDVGLTDEAKTILADYGIATSGMTESRLKAFVLSRLNKARNTGKKIIEEYGSSVKEGNIKREFDEMTATLMAHFKFQIDMATMKATIYGHLICRFRAEIKAQAEALKKNK